MATQVRKTAEKLLLSKLRAQLLEEEQARRAVKQGPKPVGKLAHAASTAVAAAGKGTKGRGGKKATAAGTTTGAAASTSAPNVTTASHQQTEHDDDDDYDGPSTSTGIRPKAATSGDELLAAQLAADDRQGSDTIRLGGAGVLGAEGVDFIERELQRGAEQGQTIEETVAQLEDDVELEGNVEDGVVKQLCFAMPSCSMRALP